MLVTLNPPQDWGDDLHHQPSPAPAHSAPAHSASAAAFDALAPLRFPPDLRLTPEQFELLCAANREAMLELAADGRVIAMTPTDSETGLRNGELLFQLKLYAKRAGGWKAFDSSTGRADRLGGGDAARVGPRGALETDRATAARPKPPQ